ELGRTTWTQAIQLLDAWARVVDSTTSLARQGLQAEALASHDQFVEPARIALQESIESGIAQFSQVTDETIQAADDANQQSQMLILVGGLLAVIVGFLSGALLNRAITVPLQETTGVL